MSTFKITTYCKDLAIFTVETFHNVTDQSALLDTVANRIKALGLLPSVHCTIDDVEADQAFNHLLKSRIGREYFNEYFDNL